MFMKYPIGCSFRLGIKPLFGDESAFSTERLSVGERGLIPKQRLDIEPERTDVLIKVG